jgi:predicted permease
MGIERWLYRVSMRLRSLFHGTTLDRELDEELQYHVERLVEANRARGLSPDAARREALLAIGGVEQRKEECRDTRRVRFIDDLLQDSRYAARALWRSRSFTIAAILTLTLGIGATVAIFTVVHGVLLRPLPFPEPDRLFLASLSPRGPFMRQPAMSDRSYLAFRAGEHPFEHLAAFSTYNGNLTGSDDPVVITVGSVTTEFFDAFGVAPLVGRAFLDGDGQEGREPVVVLSERLWRARFGSDEAIVGKAAVLDGVSHSVVGIMPPGFDFPRKAQAWTPKVIRIDGGNSLMFPVLGRLKPDVSVAEARAQFAAQIRRLPDQPDGDTTGWQVGLLPLEELVVGDIRRPLEIFAGAVCLVLMISCANVANLLLARSSGRRREIAVRAALGASRLRLVRQLLTESTLLSLAGGAVGILLARWAVPALLALAPAGRIPRLESIRIDAWILAFTVVVSAATGLAFGLVPALRLTRRQFAGTLLPGGRTFGTGQERIRTALVVSEIALALVLVTGAGLLAKSFLRLRAVDPGFRTDNVVSLSVELPGSVYASAQKLQAFHQDMLTRLSGLPNVAVASVVNWRPLGTQYINGDFNVEGRAAAPDFNVDKVSVGPGYFPAMGIRILQGRDFNAGDTASSTGVAIISRTVARTMSATEDALGKRVTLESNPNPNDWLTVVGVVDDVKPYGPSQPFHAAVYQPYLQVRRPFFLSHMSYVVRTKSDPARAIPAIRTVLRTVDRDQPPASIALMDDVLNAATAEPGFHARLLGVFAALALMLAVVGTYGVLAYSVSQRTHEIGLRMALGARASTVLWMVIRRTLILSAAGVAIGTLGAWLATRLLTTFLFETTPTDAGTFTAVALTIFIAALAAGFVPARRATQVDPLVALRHE